MTFDSGGSLKAPVGVTKFDNFTPRTSITAQPLSIDYTGSSQSGSIFSVASRTQDGKSVGLLSGVSVGDDGLVTASFSNGETAALGKVAVATFVNMPGLRQEGTAIGKRPASPARPSSAPPMKARSARSGRAPSRGRTSTSPRNWST